MTVLAMSHGELSRFDTLMRVECGELRVEHAATVLGLKRRQIFRLLKRLRSDGAAGLVSRKRGRPSNRRHSHTFREQVITIVREQYADFGPTLTRESLLERHGIKVSCETSRQFMIEAGLWKDREARRPRPYQPRYRRYCRVELTLNHGPHYYSLWATQWGQSNLERLGYKVAGHAPTCDAWGHAACHALRETSIIAIAIRSPWKDLP